MIQNPQIVAMFFEFPLNLVGEITELHDDDQACHRQKDIRPQKHMKMVSQINQESSKIKAELCVVRHWSSFVP